MSSFILRHSDNSKSMKTCPSIHSIDQDSVIKILTLEEAIANGWLYVWHPMFCDSITSRWICPECVKELIKYYQE